MTRARIASLALVNWKGVFYERYLLDRHVTALEGANGAGKTTVMIAAYVVLLPDMSRLRFTNLGETAATGGDRGIWGRLGEPGRPAYAALDLDLAGERVLLGVRLTRASEPSVEVTTFMVSGLAESVRLSEILLARRDDGDHVPELDEIATAVVAAGGTIEVFRSVKDYFTVLFERGITPLRLSLDEERTKWNDLLRTSMTGGISRALTSELRGFVLKEETGLGDTLSRMRANLEACRRTRVEVFESRQLEREISALYEAGLAMFAAALHATRAAANEAAERSTEAARTLQHAEHARAELDHARDALTAREQEHGARSSALRALVPQLMAAVEHGHAATMAAARNQHWHDELAAHAAACEDAERTRQLCARARAAADVERTRALEAYDRASVGLAHAQQGLDEMSRRAHAARQLQRSLTEARALLDNPSLGIAAVPAALVAVDQERARCESERASLERETSDLAARRAEHARAVAALAQCSPEAHADDGAASLADHARARAVLAQLSEREHALAQREPLERSLREAERLATRQHAARTLAASLAVHDADAVLRELDAVERALLEADAAIHAAVPAAHTHASVDALRAQLTALDEHSARYRMATETAARLAVDQPVTTAHQALELRDRILERQLALHTRRHAIERERDALQQRAGELGRAGAHLDPELVRLCEELGAELLASRFEDLDVASAAQVEARLGPLVSALVVDDPQLAAAALAKLEHTRAHVLLIRAGSALELPPLTGAEPRSVICEEPFGVRVTRVAERPSLGRRARERELSELHAAIAAHAATLDELNADARRLASQRRDADALVAHGDVLAAGDPAAQRARLEAALAALERERHGQREAADAARTQQLQLRPRREGLRRLLPDAQLLAAPDYAERARELSRERLQLLAASAELARLAEARAQLAELLDVLRNPPPDDAALAAAAARTRALASRHEQLFRARAALEAITAHAYAEAFGDPDAVLRALDAQASLAPALEQQHAAARSAVQAADAAEREAGAAWEAATAALQAVEAQRAVLLAQRERAQTELLELGGAPTVTELAEREQQLERARAELDALDVTLRRSVAERALSVERSAQAERAVASARAHAAAVSGDAEPLSAAWRELRAAAETEGLLQAAWTAAHPGSSLQLRAEAASKRELLLDRLARTRGGDELLAAIREPPPAALAYLDCWQAVRAWLQRRVPVQVAEVDDPLLALLRLRDHLSLLEGRLQRQEGDLRGASEDVARGIDVQLRRARAQVRRLNQQLSGIRFGAIHGIRIEMRRIERMEQILRALRAGEAQELLFSSALPIEEALAEIFKRFGGGGRGGGQRLLDYREYVELVVEIRRQTASAWEPASPTRLSTGEAIGVGAALMMVVLTEWERDANLLRARGKLGSLRCLFLDEANRLSRDNLGVLFDLCRTLDLQLLIAAPEVARADGNTTYRLVRHVTEDGREEVIVSGRRAFATETEASATPEETVNS